MKAYPWLRRLSRGWRRRSVGAALLLLGLAAGLAAPSAASAQEAGQAPILIIGLEEVFRDSAPAIAIREEVERLRAATQADLEARQEALLAEERALVALRATLEGEAFSERADRFQEQARALRRERAESGSRLQRAFGRATQELQDALQPILLQIMVERRAAVLLDKRNVVLSATALDVTEEAIARLNAAAPQIEVRAEEAQDP